MARREALGLLMRAEEAFRRCDPKYLEAVDNYAYLCLGESVCLSVCPVYRSRECACCFARSILVFTFGGETSRPPPTTE